MSDDERMSIDERFKYLRLMYKRYAQADRAERTRLLDEMEMLTGQHRKSLIRAMRQAPQRQPRGQQRGRGYGAEVDDALRVIAESLDYICAERLTAALVPMAQHLAAHGELQLSSTVLSALERISVATVRRYLQRLQQDEPRLPRKKASVSSSVLRDIPMTRIPWDQSEPGHFEVDLVHHCGASSSGEYLHTLQMVDVATGWSERVALLGRSYRVVHAAFEHCLARLPFPIREIHPDNGSEFLNDHVLTFFHSVDPTIVISRSRPHHPNDNRCVEQKNGSLIRAYLGDVRLDTVQHTLLLNQLYDAMWLYYNFFQPVMRLRSKTNRTDDHGATHIKRRYDQPTPPFDRLCALADAHRQTSTAAPLLAQADRLALQARRLHTNPRRLRLQIYQALDRLFSLPTAAPGVTESVFDTIPIILAIPKGEDTLVRLSFD